MERTLAFFDGRYKSPAQDIDAGVVRKLHVVCTCHYRDKEIIRGIRWFAWLANHGKHWSQALETCHDIVRNLTQEQNVALV